MIAGRVEAVGVLLSLLAFKVRAMSERNVRAVYTGKVDNDTEVETDILTGKYQLVFMSPEALLGNDKWRDMLVSSVYQQNLVGLVDKAHCVKKW